MMIRKAILIEAPNVKGLDYLPGATADMDNWESFLKSSAGGAWKDNEICRIRQNKSFNDILNMIRNSPEGEEERYIFVAFSGHGFVDKRDGKGEFKSPSKFV